MLSKLYVIKKIFFIFLAKILNNEKSYQIHFYNIGGIEIITKEFKSFYTDEKIKEIDDKIKQLKTNKNSIFIKDYTCSIQSDNDSKIFFN